MRIPRSIICCLWPMLLFAWPSLAQAKSEAETFRSVRDFVSEFYSWYVPEAVKKHKGPAWDLVLKYKGHTFSAELFRALRDDSRAQARVQGEIVGLDFDPFLNTQDPCESYELGNITRKDHHYRIDLYSVCSGKRSERPSVICEVARTNGNWVFVNFLYENMMKEYPNSANLLATLKLLQEERKHNSP